MVLELATRRVPPLVWRVSSLTKRASSSTLRSPSSTFEHDRDIANFCSDWDFDMSFYQISVSNCSGFDAVL